MVTLLADLHFWTLREDIIVKDADIGAHRYQEKSSIGRDRPYYNQRKKYVESRGSTIILKNSRPLKLKDSLREFEEILAKEKLVNEGWRGGSTYQIFFASGLIVLLTVNSGGDLVSVVFDKFLVGKLASENVVDVVFSSSYLIYSYNDSRVTLIQATKPLLLSGSKLPFRFSSQEPKIALCEGIGPPGRRFERKLSINLTEKMMLAWWETGEDEVYPWSPVNKDRDRANLLVYSLNGASVNILCYCRTELSPLSVTFSQIEENVILTVEQGFDKVGGVTVLSCVYEVDKNSLRRVSVTSIPLDAPLTAHSHNPSETGLLLACNNGVLALHCESRGMTHVTKAGLVPSCITWLNSGTLLGVINERGQMQIFDMALSLVRIQLLVEDSVPQRILDFSEYFSHQTLLRRLKWAPLRPIKYPVDQSNSNLMVKEIASDSLPLLILHFANGPLACIRIASYNSRTAVDSSVTNTRNNNNNNNCIYQSSLGAVSPDLLVRQYVKHRQWDEAINLLVSLSWESEGTVALQCLFTVVSSLLKLPLNSQREAQLEAALSSFLLSPVRFSPAVEEEFGASVRALTRRFFFKLLRNGSLEKSYRLAIDLKDHDCFLNVHHVARCYGNKELASLSMQSARELNSDSCWSGSCSSFLCSDSEGDTNGNSSSDTESSCSTCTSGMGSPDQNRRPEERDGEGDGNEHPDVFTTEKPNEKKLSHHHVKKSSKIPPPVPPVTLNQDASSTSAVAVQSSQDGTITINIRQGGQPTATRSLNQPRHHSLNQIPNQSKDSVMGTSVRGSADAVNGSISPLPNHSQSNRLFPQIPPRLCSKKDNFLSANKSGLPGRLKTVKEVCEASLSSGSNEDLPEEGRIVSKRERAHLQSQYEQSIFQEVTTEEEDGGTVKVVHFGVV